MWVGAHWGFVIFKQLLAFNSKIVDTLDVWRRGLGTVYSVTDYNFLCSVLGPGAGHISVSHLLQ